MPEWVSILAIVSLVLGGVSGIIIVIDLLAGYRQHMWIMNLVWPITALYSGPLGLWAYYRIGRLTAHQNVSGAQENGEKPGVRRKAFWQAVGVAATHCGSGCALGDLCAEWLIMAIPFALFGKTIFAAWTLDYLFAFTFGIVFQYCTITPMRRLSPGRGLLAALKADSASLTAWQIGMYGWMALVTFGLLGHEFRKTTPVFWFMMQVAMLAGFVTSYPVNWWLVRQGIKEQM